MPHNKRLAADWWLAITHCPLVVPHPQQIWQRVTSFKLGIHISTLWATIWCQGLPALAATLCKSTQWSPPQNLWQVFSFEIKSPLDYLVSMTMLQKIPTSLHTSSYCLAVLWAWQCSRRYLHPFIPPVIVSLSCEHDNTPEGTYIPSYLQLLSRSLVSMTMPQKVPTSLHTSSYCLTVLWAWQCPRRYLHPFIPPVIVSLSCEHDNASGDTYIPSHLQLLSDCLVSMTMPQEIPTSLHTSSYCLTVLWAWQCLRRYLHPVTPPVIVWLSCEHDNAPGDSYSPSHLQLFSSHQNL